MVVDTKQDQNLFWFYNFSAIPPIFYVEINLFDPIEIQSDKYWFLPTPA